jgi:hypothetical protein
MDACPDGLFIGAVKIFTFPSRSYALLAGSLNLDKNEHFSKVSMSGKIPR